MKAMLIVCACVFVAACGGTSMDVDDIRSMDPRDDTTDEEPEPEKVTEPESSNVAEVPELQPVGEDPSEAEPEPKTSRPSMDPIVMDEEPEAPMPVAMDPEPEEAAEPEAVPVEESEPTVEPTPEPTVADPVENDATPCTLAIQSTETLAELDVRQTVSNLHVVPTKNGFVTTWRFGDFGEEGEPIQVNAWSLDGTPVGDQWMLDQSNLIGLDADGDRLLVRAYSGAERSGTWFDLQGSVIAPLEPYVSDIMQTTENGIFYARNQSESSELHRLTFEEQSLVTSLDTSQLTDIKGYVHAAFHEEVVAMAFTVESEDQVERGIEVLVQGPDGVVVRTPIVRYQTLEEELERNVLMVGEWELFSADGGFILQWFDRREDWYGTKLTYISDDGQIVWERALPWTEHLVQLPNGAFVGEVRDYQDGPDSFGLVVLDSEGVEQQYVPLTDRTGDLVAIAGHYTENAFSVLWSDNAFNLVGEMHLLFGACE